MILAELSSLRMAAVRPNSPGRLNNTLTQSTIPYTSTSKETLIDSLIPCKTFFHSSPTWRVSIVSVKAADSSLWGKEFLGTSKEGHNFFSCGFIQRDSFKSANSDRVLRLFFFSRKFF